MQTQVEGYTLSPQQKRVWHHISRKNGGKYIQSAVLIEGPINADKLSESLQKVISEHEILQVRLETLPGMKTPVQVAAHSGPPAWKFSESFRAETVGATAEFDNLKSSVFEKHARNAELCSVLADLVRLSDERCYLFISVFAVYGDIWSVRKLLEDVFSHYESVVGGEDEELISYFNFDEWQSEIFDSEEAGAGLSYWSEKLKRQDESPLFGPNGDSMPSSESEKLFLKDFRLPDELAHSLLEKTKEHRCTVEEWLFACWNLLLVRLSGAAELRSSLLFVGRKYEELHRTLGVIDGYVPLIAAPVEEELNSLTYISYVSYLKTEIEEARQWLEYYPGIGQQRNGSRPDNSRLPYGFEFIELLSRNIGQFKVAQTDLQFDIEPIRLRLSCLFGSAGLNCRLIGTDSHYSEEALTLLAERFEQLLKSTLEKPTENINRLALVGPGEKEKLLDEWNRTDFDTTGDIVALFERQAARTPEAVAVSDARASLTYDQLNRLSNRLAHRLLRLGAGRETLVGLSLGRSVWLPAAVLGTLKAGAAYVPLDPAYPAERLAYMADDAKLRAIVRDGDGPSWSGAAAEEAAEIDLREVMTGAAGGAEEENPGEAIDGRQLAYVIYTSGSTGRPKGVGIEHSGLNNYIAWAVRNYQVASGEGTIVHSSLGFDLTVTGLILPLLCGKQIRMIAAEPSIEELAATIVNSSNLSLVKLTPAHLNVLVHLLRGKELENTVRTFVIGGEALFYEQLLFWQKAIPGVRLINEYGPTETVVGCVTYDVCDEDFDKGAVPIGRPIGNTKIYVLDKTLNPVPVGAVGELYIGGAGVSRGYIGRAALTAEAFLPNPYEMSGSRMYKTGDLVRYRVDGLLEYIGRYDHQVKIKGHRIELGEIESAVKQADGIADCVVLVDRERPGSEDELICFLEAREKVDVARLKAELEARLPGYMIPQSYVVLEAIPLTENGKIDRKALLQLKHKSQKTTSPYAAPRNALEDALARIWGEVLRVEKVGVYDNFFDLGGDSIRSVRVVALAKEEGLNFTVQQLFGDQTIAGLAARLEQNNQVAENLEKAKPFSLIGEQDREKLGDGIEDAYPLAMIQAAMLYHMELTPDSPAYLNVNSWHLKAPYDETALRKSFEEVTRRHKVLRTSFNLTGFNQPLQLVHSDAEPVISFEDLRHLSPEKQEKYLNDFYEAERKNLFDLSLPTQMRFYFHRRTDETFQFSFTENHAIIDGWSTTSTLAETFENYLALIEGRPIPERENISLEYRDFIKLERDVLKDEKTKAYWARMLEDATPVELPKCTQVDPLPNGKRVDYLNLRIEESLLKKLRERARSLNVPLKTLLFAAHIKAMSMMSGLTDFTTGVTTNGRPEEADGTAVRGNFLNTVPFRIKLEAGSWSRLIRQVFEAERAMLPFRRYPLGAMQREAGQRSLVETAFAYLHFHSVEGLLKRGKIEILEDGAVDLSETNFPLQTVFIVSPLYEQSLAWLQVQIDTHVTSAETRHSILSCYRRTLEAIAADPSSHHHAMENLAAPEKQKIVLDWNRTEHAIPENRTVIDLLKAQVEREPQKEAVEFGEKSISFEELAKKSDLLADFLIKQGVGPERIVAISMRRSPDLLVSILAVLKAGGAYLPLDPDNPKERINYILFDSKAELLLSDADTENFVETTSVRKFNVAAVLDEIQTAVVGEIQVPVDRDNLAYVIYTSGSTGNPKGTLITHDGLINYLTWCTNDYGSAGGNGAPLHSSVSFDLSVTSLFLPLLQGQAVRILADDVGIEALVSAINDQPDYSFIKATPTQLELLNRILPAEKIRSVTKSLILGGENLKAETVEFWRKNAPGIEIINEYGPTETVVGCCTFRLGETDCPEENIPIGKPIINTSIYILDSYLHPVQIGSIGEIYIGGRGVARGYLNRPELTAEKFIPNPFSERNGGQRIYRTGDLARFREDGVIEYLGRRDSQIKIRGFRVEIGEIESVIQTHPRISATIVTHFLDPAGAGQLAAYLVSDEELPPQELRDWLRAKLPDYMIPAKFIRLADLPLATSGKIDYKALPSPAEMLQKNKESADVLPRNDAENIIYEVWKEVLGVEALSVRDNFFDLGGDSFKLYEVHAKLREKMKTFFTILDIFQYPTIDSFAAYLSRQNDENSFDEVQERAAKRKNAVRRRGTVSSN